MIGTGLFLAVPAVFTPATQPDIALASVDFALIPKDSPGQWWLLFGSAGSASDSPVATPTALAGTAAFAQPLFGPGGSLLGDGTAEHPDGGLLLGNGFSYDASTCASGPCNGGNAGLIVTAETATAAEAAEMPASTATAAPAGPA
jgi:hypothetical protein